jgi:hypothetical protein
VNSLSPERNRMPSLRVLIPVLLLAVALLIPASADARRCSVTTDAPAKDLRATGVSCKVANTVAKKYINRCMGAPCKIRVADIRWSCEARERNVCKSKDRKDELGLRRRRPRVEPASTPDRAAKACSLTGAVTGAGSGAQRPGLSSSPSSRGRRSAPPRRRSAPSERSVCFFRESAAETSAATRQKPAVAPLRAPECTRRCPESRCPA